MLKKLLKYEYKATSRIMLPLYTVLVFMAALSRLGSEIKATTAFGNDFFAALNLGYTLMFALMNVIMFFVCAITAGATFVLCIKRFYTNVLTDEGYLTNTLPVKAYHIVLSKMLVSLTWVVASVFVGAVAFEIVNGESANFLRQIIDEIEISWVFMSLIYIVYSILFFYLAMSLGQLVNRHKKWMSFGAVIAINSIVSTVRLVISGVLYELKIIDLEFGIYVYIAFMALLSVLYFVLVTKILENRLNLE